MDEAHVWTDEELAKLEQKITREYEKAANEMDGRVADYFESFAGRDAEQRARLEAGEISEQYYNQWRLNQIGRGERMEALRDQLAERMTKANEVAAAYINDITPGIYSLNRNYAAYTIEKVAGNVGFTLWDEQTVKRLIVESPDLMPYYPPQRAIDRGIDLAWGKQQITKQITSSILQGDSLKRMADSLCSTVFDKDRVGAIRAARTATTGAQNAGRLDSYEAAKGMGIKLKKEWLATLDNRTRHEHAKLDGQVVETDQPFEVDGYALMFPGDPNGAPEMVYNCRCTMIAAVDGIDTSDAKRWSRNLKTNEVEIVPDMTYTEWAGWKENNVTYYKEIKIPGVSAKELKELNDTFKHLDAKYGAKVTGVMDALAYEQEMYDIYFENTVKDRMENFPNKRRSTIEKQVREMMGERPESVSMFLGGRYNMDSGVMSINPLSVHGSQSFLENAEHRKKQIARWERRGRQPYNFFGNVGDSLSATFVHEYGHALDATYGISENAEFVSYYRKFNAKDVEYGLSSYGATNEMEFIAECFAESFFPDTQGDISKGFMKILEGIVNASH